MNKWEDSFKKTSLENNGKVCHCSGNQGLFVPNRQLSALVALLLLLFFSIFMTGYFLGKKKAVEQFTQEMRQEAFADQIYTTVLATPQETQQSSEDMLLVMNVDDIATIPSPSINQDIENNNQVNHNDERYYAQLIGFGTEKSAQLFVKKLASKGIETEIKKRVSKSVKGHTSYWYQVITAEYSNKSELVALVERITKEENIKDACIRVC